MNNPWYDRVNGQGTVMQTPYYQQPMQANQNPLMVMGQLANAMRNPMAFAMNAFRDVPQELWSNPERALEYIQRTRNLSQADIQNMLANFPIPR